MKVFVPKILTKDSHDFLIKGDKLCFNTLVVDYSSRTKTNYSHTMKIFPFIIPGDDSVFYMAVADYVKEPIEDVDLKEYNLLKVKVK